MMNPEAIELVNRQSAKPVSDFSLVGSTTRDQQFQRIKSSEAAHEISQVMQAAAKSQREASANAQKQHQ